MNDDYRELLCKVGEHKFKQRLEDLITTINDFLREAGFPESVECNERILYHVLLDYYADIERLKDFHGIDYTKSDKINAYLIYWIVKRKPIQFAEYSDKEKDIFVNERFACYLLVNECLLLPKNANTKLSKDNLKKFDNYIEYLLYYFKYRTVSAQVIELLIESFKIGRCFPI